MADTICFMAAGHTISLKSAEYAPLFYFAEKLELLGIEADFQHRANHTADELYQCFTNAAKHHKYIIVINETSTGQQDIAKTMFRDLFSLPLAPNNKARQYIAGKWGKPSNPMPEPLEQLAFLPSGSQVLQNTHGFAPGYVLNIKGCITVVLPNQPDDIRLMLEQRVMLALTRTCEKRFESCRVSSGKSVNACPKIPAMGIAAAIAGPYLAGEISGRYQGHFQRVVNAYPEFVREKVLEVPKKLLHQNGGVSAEAAMIMAHHVMAIFKTSIGFAMILPPNGNTAAVACTDGERVTGTMFSVPRGCNEQAGAAFTLDHAIEYLDSAIRIGFKNPVPISELKRKA